MSASSSRRSPLRAKLRETVSDAILDAAEAVAIEGGIETATAAAIAARAGVAVGTLYNYFRDRDGILTELFRTRRAQILPVLEEIAERAQQLPFDEGLRLYIREVLRAFEEKKNFLRLSLLVDETSKIRGRDRTLMTRVLQHLETILTDGANRKKLGAARIPAYARMIQGTLKGLVMWRVGEGAPLEPDADLVVDTFLRGATR